MQTQNSSLPLPQCDNLLRLRRQVDERPALRLPFPESELDTVTQALREGTWLLESGSGRCCFCWHWAIWMPIRRSVWIRPARWR